jgi:hypothetical protein
MVARNGKLAEKLYFYRVYICKIGKQIKVQVGVKIAECSGVRERHGQAVS